MKSNTDTNTDTAANAQESQDYLVRLQEGGWDLSGVDLDNLERRIRDVHAANNPLKFGTALCNLVSQAHAAIEHERTRRDAEWHRNIKEQHDRVGNIRRVAQGLRDVDKLVDAISAVRENRALISSQMPSGITSATLDGMDERQLDLAIGENDHMRMRAEGESRQLLDEADTLTRYRFKNLASVLKDLAADAQGRAQIHRDNADAIREELDARAKRAKAEQDARDNLPETTATLEELVARVAELESKLANNN